MSINEINNEKELIILSNQLNYEYINSLLNLLNKQNNKLSYVILWILINLSYIDKNEVIFSENFDIIYKISSFLGKNKSNKILTYRGILLLKNISAYNLKVRQILLKYNILQYFIEIYEKYNLDNKFVNKLLSCIGNFIINPYKEFIKEYISIFKIIKTQLNPSTNIKYLDKYLFFIFNLFLLNSKEIIKEMIKEDIFKNLINIYPFEESNNKIVNEENFISKDEEEENKKHYYNIKLLILKVLGKLLSFDEEIEETIIQKMIDFDIIHFLNKIIDTSNNDFKIIKNVAFCLSNLSTGNIEQINKLYNTGIFIKLIKIADIFYKSLKNNLYFKENEREDLSQAFIEICYVFALVIINSIYEKLLPLVKYNNYSIIIYLIEGLNLFKDNIIFADLCLNSFYHLISYDKNMEEFNSNIRVSELNASFSEFMDKNGIKSILEYYIINKNNKITKLAEKLYHSIY